MVDRAGADSMFAGDEMHWLFDILFGSACIRQWVTTGQPGLLGSVLSAVKMPLSQLAWEWKHPKLSPTSFTGNTKFT